MDQDIAVREATIPDLDEIAPLFDLYRQFYGQPADLSRAHDFLRARLEQSQSRILFAVLMSDSQVVGFVQVYPSFSSVRCRPIWILNDLFVSASARNRGVGEALLQAAAEMAARETISYIELTTAHSNADAQRLYVRCGYVLDENFRTYGLALNA